VLSAGRYGQLAFEYRGDDLLFGAASPSNAVAAGTQVDLEVFADKGTYSRELAERQRPFGEPTDGMLRGALPEKPSRSSVERALVRSASTPSPEVVEIAGTGPSHVRLRARARGSADVQVEASGKSDVIAVTVAEVQRLEIDHWARPAKAE